MRMFLTDDQFIARLRKNQRYRRKLGWAWLIVGGAMVVFVLWWLMSVRAQALAALKDFDPAVTPTTQAVDRAVDQARFHIGFGLGFAFATILTGGLLLAMSGLVMLLAKNRAERLLLERWDAKSPEAQG